jgi:transposase InsO family protein
VAVVFDAFSRMPLQAAVFWAEPSAAAILALLQAAIRDHGKPRHFVSDRGSQFIAEEFRGSLADLGMRQRFGALYRHGSIALLERFFRTLKEDLRLSGHRPWRPWSRSDLEGRLASALLRYAYCRPHTALGGRVPAEVFFGIADQRPLLNGAPRGRPADPEADCPVAIVFLDPEDETLPILNPKAA